MGKARSTPNIPACKKAVVQKMGIPHLTLLWVPKRLSIGQARLKRNNPSAKEK